MIPLRDDQPSFSTPFITYFLIVVNVLIFVWELSVGHRALNGFMFEFGIVPHRTLAILTGQTSNSVGTAFLPLFTSMFLHGSFLHLAGNMLALWIFGDNIEDYLGHFNFLFVYLASGIIGGFTHILLNVNSRVPTIGASGAIAGIMGAYFILYPRARVLTWIFIVIVWLPAWLVLGYWFLVQFVSVSQIADTGVAVGAHLGGFAAGVLMIKVFPQRPHRYRYGTW
jgi:membrane associated rhomboid family serine protease